MAESSDFVMVFPALGRRRASFGVLLLEKCHPADFTRKARISAGLSGNETGDRVSPSSPARNAQRRSFRPIAGQLCPTQGDTSLDRVTSVNTSAGASRNVGFDRPFAHHRAAAMA